jgi:hypothetical protein
LGRSRNVTTSENAPPAQSIEAPRSNFVTVLAWVLIVGSGLLTFVAVMQAVMLTFVFPHGFWSNPQPPHASENIPPLVQFLASKAQYFFLAFWLLAVVTLAASIGLLRRKNWARLIVICIFGLGVVWNLGGIWLQGQMVSTFTQLPAQTPPEFAQQMQHTFVVMRVVTAIFAIAVAIVFAWLIRRLVSARVKAEFGAL